MATLNELREKIEGLEKEKSSLVKEVQELKREAEGKAVALECEVAVLREEADTLKRMLSTF
ncbi:MAG: hypothetical protein NWF03_03365 [Candidatus Bathyarchaeota archaeon]|nr:hypothetical protein [Candidatus Bathyarchaeota archaeon]